jgi:hypothetical protein
MSETKLVPATRPREIKRQRRLNTQPQDDEYEGNKKDKKLVFLSKSVLQKVRERPMVTGTQIANEILEMYKQFCDVSIISLIARLVVYLFY